MLDHRFGNPIHVAEAYKSSLKSWPKINDGDSGGIQDFADFRVRCEEATKTMQSMGASTRQKPPTSQATNCLLTLQ